MSMVNFPEHWKRARFGEVATFTKKPRDLRYSEYDEVPFVPMDLIPIVKLFSEKFTLKTNDELSSGTYFEPGDILLAKITPSFENGKQCIIEELPTPFGIATTEVIPIREVVDVSDKFYLFYYLLLPDVRTLLAGRMQGTTGRQRLGKETLVSLEIPLPPLPEQRAIAHVLQTIQEAKAARQRELALERERKAALIDYLFSYGTKGEPRKETEIGEIPESWEIVKLGQLCRVFSGYGFKTKDYTKEGIPLIKIGNLQDGKVVINPDNDCMPESWQQKEQLQKFILKSRDILIALTGATTGKTAVVPPSLAGTFLNQRVGKIEMISPNAEQDFILVVIKTRFFQEAIQQNILRSAQGNISPSSIAQIPIPLPLLPEQRTIASVFQAINEKTAALKGEAERLDELFRATLHELMTGKRSAVPLIDVESVQSASSA